MSKYRYTVITCNFGGYEIMREIINPLDDVEYLYITDDKTIRSNTWNVIYEDSYNEYENPFDKVVVFRGRVLEYCNTDICVRIDGSINIHGNSFENTVNEMIKENKDISFIMSSRFNHYSEELEAWEKQRNIDKDILMDFVRYANLNDFDYENDLNNICVLTILLQRNNEINKELNKKQLEVLKEIKEYNKRNVFYRVDQIVFTYVLNTFFNDIKVLPLHYDVISNELTQICFHNTNNGLYDYNVSTLNKLYLFNKVIDKLYNGFIYNVVLTKEDIIQNSKKIHLNIDESFYDDKELYCLIRNSFNEWVEREDVLTLDIDHGYFFNTNRYERYFVNETYYEIVLKKLCETLNIPFNEEDFNIFKFYENKIYFPKEITDHIVFTPKIIENEGHYEVYYDTLTAFRSENTFSFLNKNKSKPYLGYENNNFSSQFKYSFTPFKISKSSSFDTKERNLLVITDGSITPFIYILMEYYKTVIVIDNYFYNMNFDYLYTYLNITDILILTSTNKPYELIINNL
jgi:hypothetical protein